MPRQSTHDHMVDTLEALMVSPRTGQAVAAALIEMWELRRQEAPDRQGQPAAPVPLIGTAPER